MEFCTNASSPFPRPMTSKLDIPQSVMHGRCDVRPSSHTALLLSTGSYPLPSLLRVGGQAGLSGWLHTNKL